MKFISPDKLAKPEGEQVSRFLHPGEFFFCEASGQIHTLLGSCIAITLWHPILKIGGMCHFVLPGGRSTSQILQASGQLNGRYANEAMALFERAVSQHGAKLKEFEGKIFGGSNMLTNNTLEEDELIGNKNTQAAISLLSDKGIELLVAHVGETGHRRIAFDVSSGDVWVKFSPIQSTVGN